jgi:PAS domain S-box-containing protein
MSWAVGGLICAAVYVAASFALGVQSPPWLVVRDAALLLSPIVPLAVLAKRRGEWLGRHALFIAAIGAWPLLWLAGFAGGLAHDVRTAPAWTWPILLQFSASTLPLIALVALPHRGVRRETAVTATVDVAALSFLAGFISWCVIIAPRLDPRHASTPLDSLIGIGAVVRLAAVASSLALASKAAGTAWAPVYRRLAYALATGLIVLVQPPGLSGDSAAAHVLADVAAFLPFWWAAWPIATAPPSEDGDGVVVEPMSTVPVGHSSPALLFAAVLAVPLVGYGARFVVPLDAPVEDLREIATAFTLVCGVVLIMIRLVVEQRSVEGANARVRLLATACESAAELIVITGLNRIEYANHAFCEATGYSREEILKLAPMDLVGDQSRPDVPEMRERLRERQVIRETSTMKRKDGTTFEAAWSAVTISDGHALHVVTVIRDLTEELQLRDRLIRRERLSAVGELVSGVAHELNNPLQSVLGTIEVLCSEDHPPAIRQDLERAGHEIARAARIIRQLLTFVRKSPVARLISDLNEIVHATVAVRAYELAQANIQVREQYATNLPVVLVNRDEIQQVILNLIMNAQRAMAEANGGGVLLVRTFATGSQVSVEIEDDGPGIAPELKGRMFEPFVTTKTLGTGTGLGLSLAFGIVSAHDGRLELVTRDRGACFRLTLPGAGFPGPPH